MLLHLIWERKIYSNSEKIQTATFNDHSWFCYTSACINTYKWLCFCVCITIIVTKESFFQIIILQAPDYSFTFNSNFLFLLYMNTCPKKYWHNQQRVIINVDLVNLKFSSTVNNQNFSQFKHLNSECVKCMIPICFIIVPDVLTGITDILKSTCN